jgi:N-acyl-D-aspartate/D-glutamate deacylase
MNMSFLNYCALNMLPDWGPVLGLPVAERIEKLRDPDTRRFLEDRAHSDDAGVFARLTDFGNYVIGDTYSEANEGLKGRVVRDIAAERDADPFATLLDIVINDDLRTILWPIPTDGDDASWRMRQELWSDPRAMIGGSDAGAHLDRMCGSSYTTRFIGDSIRGRQLVSMERAVQMLTSEPADLFGLKGRGRLAEGEYADLVVFDPDTIGAGHATLVHDLPGDSARLTAEATGVVRVLVNGVVTVVDNEATGAVPGTVLRAGRDTDTVSPSA